MKKFIQCRSCPNITKKGPAPGYYYEIVNGTVCVVECDCHIKYRQEIELERKCKESGINPESSFNGYRGTESIEDFNAVKYVSENPEKFLSKMIYIYGKNSCQKTTTVQALGKVLISNKYKVKYITMNDLIDCLLTDFNEEIKDMNSQIEKECSEADFLIIDESFDKSKVNVYKSGYQMSFITNFLKKRFEIDGKSIIFVSNVPPNDITEQGFTIDLQEMVCRNTRGSYLIFKDVYHNTNTIDRLSLFKD